MTLFFSCKTSSSFFFFFFFFWLSTSFIKSHPRRYLDRLQHWGLISLRSFHSLASGSIGGHNSFATALAVHVHKLVEVEAGPLHHLHLPDVHIVQRVDALAGFLNV